MNQQSIYSDNIESNSLSHQSGGASYKYIFKFRNIRTQLDGAFRPDQLKGSYDCLTDQYKYLSPINGVILLKSKTIESLFISKEANVLNDFIKIKTDRPLNFYKL